jgi:hypothetical protein
MQSRLSFKVFDAGVSLVSLFLDVWFMLLESQFLFAFSKEAIIVVLVYHWTLTWSFT